MKRRFTRVLALALAVAIAFNSFNLRAFAEDYEMDDASDVSMQEESSEAKGYESEELLTQESKSYIVDAPEEDCCETDDSTEDYYVTDDNASEDESSVIFDVNQEETEAEDDQQMSVDSDDISDGDVEGLEADTDENSEEEPEEDVEECIEDDVDEVVYEKDGITYRFTITSAWNTGYNAVIRIENNTGSAIENWKVEMDYAGAIDNIWNASIESTGDGKYVIKSNGWNQDISDGGFIEFGISGKESFGEFPTAFSMLNSKSENDSEGYTVDYQVNSSWGAGFTANITINNTSDKAVEDWILEFDFDGTISHIWNGVVISHEGRHYIIRNSGHNANIAPGRSVSLGFEGVYVLNSCEPENYCLMSYNNDSRNESTVSDNSVSDNSVSNNTVSDNNISNNTVSENTVSNNTVSENTVSNNSVSFNAVEEPLLFMCDAIKVISEGSGEYISENGYAYGDMENIASYVLDSYAEMVSDVSVSSGNTLKITLINDIVFTYQIVDSSDMLNMSRGGTAVSQMASEEGSGSAVTYLRGVPTDSSEVLVWNPFDSAWGDCDETDIVRAIMEDAGVSQYLTIVSDEAADVDSLRNLGNFGLIVLATHGAEGKWLVTGEAMEANEDYLEDVLAGRMSVSSIYDTNTSTCDYRWQVSDVWLDENVDSLGNCIVLNNSCESSLNTNICDVFLNKGARTYLGYNNNVTNQYILYETGDILSQLIYDGETTEGAFTVTMDAYFGGGSFEIYGYGNVVMPYGDCQFNAMDEWEYPKDYDLSEPVDYASVSAYMLYEDNATDSIAAYDSEYTQAFDADIKNISARKFEIYGDLPLVNMYGHLLVAGGGYAGYTKEYRPVADSATVNMSVRKFEYGDVFYLDNIGSYIRFNVPCYAVASEDNCIFVPTDLDYHDSVVDAWNANGWWMSHYIQVSSVLGANGVEVPYAVAGNCSDLFYVPSYPESLSREEAVANIAGIIAGEIECEETMMPELTNPSFEDGDNGWNIGYSGGEYDNGTLINTGVCSGFEDIAPTDGENLLELSIEEAVPSGVMAEQRFFLPADSQKIYFDYNIVEALNDIGATVDLDGNMTYSPEFRMHGNIVTFDIKTGVRDEWKCIWSDCIDYTNMNELIKVDSYTYEDLYMTGWKTGCVDLSRYSGQNISIRLSINGAESMFFDASKLLVDNIRISERPVAESETITTYEVVSDENSSAYIRELGIDTEGRSHVLFAPVFEDEPEDGNAPGYQASYARLELMYRHRYEDISQVGFYRITNEDEFFNTWRDMPENPDTKMIDEVVVIMHGKYYAMTIHYVADEEGNPIVAEFLTASPDGKVGYDTSALRISDLPVRNIETIRLSSCNTGLLNAINIDCTNDMDSRVESGGKYLVQGNVAQAFLDNQNVHEVYAWDGNTNPRSRYGAERLSHTQDGFHSALKDFEDRDVEFLDIERTVWIDNYHGL